MALSDLIELQDDDICVIVTVDGRFAGIWANDLNAHDEADMIQEMMIEVMKREENRRGIWSWRFTEDSLIYAKFLRESDRDLDE